MSKLIRELATNASNMVEPGIENYFEQWTGYFAQNIIQCAAVAVLEYGTTPEEKILNIKIVDKMKEYFYSSDPDDPKPVIYLAEEATDYCKKEYKDWKTSTAWFWEEKYAELILEGCLDCVYSCDPSPKMILHEPYRSIGDAMWETFYPVEEDNE